MEEGEAGMVGLEVWAMTVDMARPTSRKRDLRSNAIMANGSTLRSHNPSVLVKGSANL